MYSSSRDINLKCLGNFRSIMKKNVWCSHTHDTEEVQVAELTVSLCIDLSPQGQPKVLSLCASGKEKPIHSRLAFQSFLLLFFLLCFRHRVNSHRIKTHMSSRQTLSSTKVSPHSSSSAGSYSTMSTRVSQQLIHSKYLTERGRGGAFAVRVRVRHMRRVDGMRVCSYTHTIYGDIFRIDFSAFYSRCDSRPSTGVHIYESTHMRRE